ncbi:MAG: hypothetical protein SGI91_02140 [Alphaproteobacteria bacterium]|nr:hypothetical protein [Alphaproteobacteria bacterium]
MIGRLALGTVCALAFTLSAQAQAFDVPVGVKLPEIDPLIPACADPAADHFIEVDISQRPPAGTTRIQKLSGWVTPEGVFHWPLVMRLRNVGDRVFAGKPGLQRAVLTEQDLLSGKTREVMTVPFDRIDPRGGVGVRFQFTAPAADMAKQRFKKVFKLAIKYDRLDASIVSNQYGDCNLQNNEFSVTFDGSRKGWIFAK